MQAQPVKVLVVEDDIALGMAVASIAKSSGYDAWVVADGRAAVQALHASRFDLVLLDIGLPLVDGWQVLARLEGNRLPSIIIISARGDALLRRGEPDLNSVLENRVAAQIDRDSHAAHDSSRALPRLGPSKHGAHSRYKLLGFEGLCQVVIGTHV